MPAWSRKRRRVRMKTKLSRFAVPYVVWMALFVVAPILIMVIYAFSDAVGHSMVDDLKAYAERSYGDNWQQRAAA